MVAGLMATPPTNALTVEGLIYFLTGAFGCGFVFCGPCAGHDCAKGCREDWQREEAQHLARQEQIKAEIEKLDSQLQTTGETVCAIEGIQS